MRNKPWEDDVGVLERSGVEPGAFCAATTLYIYCVSR